jgi:hypothetical protein
MQGKHVLIVSVYEIPMLHLSRQATVAKMRSVLKMLNVNIRMVRLEFVLQLRVIMHVIAQVPKHA